MRADEQGDAAGERGPRDSWPPPPRHSPATMQEQVRRIKGKLEVILRRRRGDLAERLKGGGGEKRHFLGSDPPPLRLRPPLAASEIEAWEAKHQAALPAEYRVFLEQVGDGGAGPHYGVLPLEKWDLGCWADDPETWRRWAATPCPLRETFLPSDDREAWLTEIGGADWEEKYNAGTWDPFLGTMTLCEVGCGGYIYLVLNGPLRGRICFGEWVHRPQFWPQPDFLAWYEAWLDCVLAGREGAF